MPVLKLIHERGPRGSKSWRRGFVLQFLKFWSALCYPDICANQTSLLGHLSVKNPNTNRLEFHHSIKRQEQNGWHFADEHFHMHFCKWKASYLNQNTHWCLLPMDQLTNTMVITVSVHGLVPTRWQTITSTYDDKIHISPLGHNELKH